MKFTKALIKGKFLKRYKRFFTDIKVNKDTIIAHCPNTGSMMGLLDEGNRVWFSKENLILLLYKQKINKIIRNMFMKIKYS